MGTLGLLLGAGGRLQSRLFRAPLLEVVVASGIKIELAFAQMQDGIDRIVQKLAVMADDQGGVRVSFQPCFEPKRPLQVEVVGRFVQEQQVGLREQGGRERHTHAPAAGEFRHGTSKIGSGKAEPAEDLGRTRGGAVGIDLDQPGVNVSHSLGRGGLELGIQRFPLGVGCQDRVQQGDRRGGMLLINRRDPGGFRQADLTPVGGEFLQNQLEQGGFADAIAPDQPDLGAHRQRDSRGIEEATAPAVEHEIVDLKHVEQHQRMGQWV